MTTQEEEKTYEVMALKTNQIIVEDRFREDLGDIDSLAQSIIENGQLQPAVVIETIEPDVYKLIAGGRRHAACYPSSA